MKFKDLKTKSVDELNKIKNDLLNDITKERALIKIGTQPKNVGKYKEAKKSIARINFIKSNNKWI